MTLFENTFENLRLELRRGCLTLAVLVQLRREHYGYTLRKDLAEHGLVIDESTLYPLLRRLESQGLLVSEWREEDKRNKRFYRLSSDGEQILGQLLNENGVLARYHQIWNGGLTKEPNLHSLAGFHVLHLGRDIYHPIRPGQSGD